MVRVARGPGDSWEFTASTQHMPCMVIVTYQGTRRVRTPCQLSMGTQTAGQELQQLSSTTKHGITSAEPSYGTSRQVAISAAVEHLDCCVPCTFCTSLIPPALPACNAVPMLLCSSHAVQPSTSHASLHARKPAPHNQPSHTCNSFACKWLLSHGTMYGCTRTWTPMLILCNHHMRDRVQQHAWLHAGGIWPHAGCWAASGAAPAGY